VKEIYPVLNKCAFFIIERQPGKGYQVASSEGSRADELKERALALLDMIGQPDPKGPSEYLRWLGPIAPNGEYVGVFARLLPNGEARYHQAWFRVPYAVPSIMRSLGFLVFISFVMFVAGVMVQRTCFTPEQSSKLHIDTKHEGSLNKDRSAPPVNHASQNLSMNALRTEIASCTDMRLKIRHYLSQEGLGAETSQSVVDEKRSVKLISDLDKLPPPQESIPLSNIEVAKLVRLLVALDEWAVNP